LTPTLAARKLAGLRDGRPQMPCRLSTKCGFEGDIHEIRKKGLAHWLVRGRAAGGGLERTPDSGGPRAPTRLNEMTIAQMQAEMAAGRLSSEELTRYYLTRIALLDQGPLGVNSVIELNPDALAIATHADLLRRQGKVLGPLHGIPVLLKDNIGSGDKMQTTAGSLGLAGSPAASDSTVAANLRAGGAVILGKTNLSEWANFRSFGSISGWSAEAARPTTRTASIAIRADRVPAPAPPRRATSRRWHSPPKPTAASSAGRRQRIVGIKPTVGLTSRAGVVRCRTRKTRSGRTAARWPTRQPCWASCRAEPTTAATPPPAACRWAGKASRGRRTSRRLHPFLDPRGLMGARVGITRQGVDNAPATVVAAWEAAVAQLRAAGATVIDLDAAGFVFPPADGEFLVLLYDFRQDVKNYFATRSGVPLAGKTLADAIDFNTRMPRTRCRSSPRRIFDLAQSLAPGPDDPQSAFSGMTYNQGLEIDRLSGVNGIDKAMLDNQLDAIVAPTDTPAWVTDLLFGDNFKFASSGLAAPPAIPSSRFRPVWCSACLSASAFWALHSASRS